MYLSWSSLKDILADAGKKNHIISQASNSMSRTKWYHTIYVWLSENRMNVVQCHSLAVGQDQIWWDCTGENEGSVTHILMGWDEMRLLDRRRVVSLTSCWLWGGMRWDCMTQKRGKCHSHTVGHGDGIWWDWMVEKRAVVLTYCW